MEKRNVWISSNIYESTTDKVLEYINHLGGGFERIHKEDMINDLEIELTNDNDTDNVTLFFDDKKLEAKGDVAMWYRRGGFSYRMPLDAGGLNDKLTNYLQDEWKIVSAFLHYFTSKLGEHQENRNNNKLKNLCVARDCGLSIPHSLVTGCKAKLEEFIEKHRVVITKPIHNGHIDFVFGDKVLLSKGLVLISKKEIEQTNERFCLSLFQEYIEKQYELRVFFLGKELYAMAIFSQLDEQTKYDYRNYNRENPNRNIPFKLPIEVEKSLHCFIEKTNLSTGSIDLIRAVDGRFVFLEVNPAGQFGWVSSNCNYYLEKRIAEALLKVSNEGQR
jgi:ATP-GRASP peptide maturase of grasp-with-spasm system